MYCRRKVVAAASKRAPSNQLSRAHHTSPCAPPTPQAAGTMPSSPDLPGGAMADDRSLAACSEATAPAKKSAQRRWANYASVQRQIIDLRDLPVVRSPPARTFGTLRDGEASQLRSPPPPVPAGNPNGARLVNPCDDHRLSNCCPAANVSLFACQAGKVKNVRICFVGSWLLT